MQFSYLAAALASLVAVQGHVPSTPRRRDSSGQRVVTPRTYFHNGQITPFTQQGQYGSCGMLNEDREKVVAISYKLQGISWPPTYCGYKVEITHEGADRNDDGSPKDRVIEATVVDTCTTCDSSHLELSIGAFEALAGGPWDNPKPLCILALSDFWRWSIYYTPICRHFGDRSFD